MQVEICRLKEILPIHYHVLDNLLQLYAHETNEYHKYSISMGIDGRYRVKTSETLLREGRGYFMIVSGKYAGFILLSNQTKAQDGVFIAEFYILPYYRQGFLFKDILAELFKSFSGMVEYRILCVNKRALLLFEFLAKRYFSSYIKANECENELNYIRFTVNTSNLVLSYYLNP